MARGSVPVTCGYCGEEREVHVKTILDRRKDGRGYTGICQKHPKEDLYSFYLSASSQQSTDNASGERAHGKGQRGRRKGVKYIDPQASRAALENAILVVWEQTKSISEITFAVVAAVYQSRGERIEADAVRKRFNDCDTGIKWRDFVVSVVGKNGN